MTAPRAFPRRILLAVTGVSPQIVTETLYRLAVDTDQPFVPTEIHLVSTSRGIAQAAQTLLDPKKGKYFQLMADYGLDPAAIRFDQGTLHEIRNAEGTVLADINDDEANRAAADSILDLVRSFVEDEQCAIHASMAGGRKTMGFFLGYAMSLLGRAQDRLSHVLVSPPFESCADFFYPPAQPEMLEIRGERVNTADARITLADIPFVRLGSGPALQNLQQGASYSSTVAQIQSSLDSPSLLLDLDAGKARAHGHWLNLGAVQFSILLWMAIRAKLARPEVQLHGHEAANSAQMKLVMEEAMVPVRSMRSWTRSASYGAEEFGPNRSRLNGNLTRQLGAAAKHYQVHQTGKRPLARYALLLDASQIQFKGYSHTALIAGVKNAMALADTDQKGVAST